jgi:hypothetical protein
VSTASFVQAALLCFYALLAVLFGQQGQWPISAYYLGCIVKDAAVFVLGLAKP